MIAYLCAQRRRPRNYEYFRNQRECSGTAIDAKINAGMLSPMRGNEIRGSNWLMLVFERSGHLRSDVRNWLRLLYGGENPRI